MEQKKLKGKGEADYDYKHDILFFKTVNREYSKSIELDNLVIDIDKEDFISGVQLFEASKFLNLDKETLRAINHWQYIGTTTEEGKIEIRLIFNIIMRNKTIEKNPIIIQSTNERLAESYLVCTV